MNVIPLLREWLNTVAAAQVLTARLWLRRSAAWAAVAAFLGLLLAAGLGFIVVGGYLSLRAEYSPWESGLMVGGTLLLLALIGALVSWLILTRQSAARPSIAPELSVPPPAEIAPTLVDPAVANFVQLGEQVSATLRGSGIKTVDVMIGALVAGIVLGGSPGLRSRVGGPRRRSPQPAPLHRARYRSTH